MGESGGISARVAGTEEFELTRRSLLGVLAGLGLFGGAVYDTVAAMPASAAVMRYKHPFDVTWRTPQNGEWGNRASWRIRPHAGVDYVFDGAHGHPIQAVSDGIVRATSANSSGELGNWVRIVHDDGAYSLYGHMLKASPWSAGDRVLIGETVGQVGNSGSYTTGTHLHLAMSMTETGLGLYSTSLSPHKYINARLAGFAQPVNIDAGDDDMRIIQVTVSGAAVGYLMTNGKIGKLTASQWAVLRKIGVTEAPEPITSTELRALRKALTLVD